MIIQDNLDCKTPKGITGVNPTPESSLKCRLDWLQGTFKIKYLNIVFILLSQYLGGGEFEERGYGIRYFINSYQHPSGAVIAVGLRRPDGSVDESYCYLELSGVVLGASKVTRTRKLLRVLDKKIHFNCTRIDVNIDDHKRRFSIRTIKSAADRHWHCGFRDTVDFREKGRRGSKGAQVSFGNRGKNGSNKRLVIYDKNLESDGLIDAIRIELSLYRDSANDALKTLAYSPVACWGEIIRGYINGAIDFKKRNSLDDKNPGRRDRPRWWKFMHDNALVIVPDVPYKISSLEKIKKWVRFIAPTLATLYLGMNKRYGDGAFDDWFCEVLAIGENNMRTKHRDILSSA